MPKNISLFTRRKFIKIALGSSLIMATARPVFGDERVTRTVDVVIIGAGLAGLTAAVELRKAGRSVCVVEARGRVGGRTLDYSIGGGHVVERGGQWIGSTQTEILSLAGQLGIESFPSYTQGKIVLHLNGARFLLDNVEDSLATKEAKYRLDQMALTVPLNKPWTAVQATAWDGLSVADWLTGNVSDAGARQSIESEIQSFLPAPTQDISLLYFLFYVHSAGGLQALNSGAQELRFKGGPQALSKKMARSLEDNLLLSSPVSEIIQTDTAVKVFSRRACIIARRAVVAMMPTDVQRIRFAPELPQQRHALDATWQGAPGFKVNVVYSTPFWRAQGLSGFSVSDDGPVQTTFDNSPPDVSRGVLLGFVQQQTALVDAVTRRQSILNALARLFGNAALTPQAYIEMDWSRERWTSGCVSILRPNVLTQHGAALRQPFQRVHWAGTETSDIWNGYMEGAVRSGKRVALEIISTGESTVEQFSDLEIS